MTPPIEVDLWFVPLSGDSDARDRAWSVLDASEQTRADRFHFEADRGHYIFSHAALRTVLGRKLGQNPADLRFASGPSGKPGLIDSVAETLHFNLSHAGTHALIGVNTLAPIGVDLESTTRDVEMSGIVDRFFAAPERAIWERIPAAEHSAAFFRAWTRKEAYVKARGDGFSHDSSRYAVEFQQTKTARLILDEIDPSAPAQYQLTPVVAPPGYEAACALRISPDQALDLKIHSWP